jgi:hypothetical protein
MIALHSCCITFCCTTLLMSYMNRYKKYDVFDTLRVPEKAKHDLQVANCAESCLTWSDLYLCLNFLDIILTFLQVCIITVLTITYKTNTLVYLNYVVICTQYTCYGVTEPTCPTCMCLYVHVLRKMLSLIQCIH